MVTEQNPTQIQVMFTQMETKTEMMPPQVTEEMKENETLNFINIKRTSHLKRIKAMLERKKELEVEISPL